MKMDPVYYGHNNFQGQINPASTVVQGDRGRERMREEDREKVGGREPSEKTERAVLWKSEVTHANFFDGVAWGYAGQGPRTG